MITDEIIGDDMQAVVLTLGVGDVVRAEAGALMYMTEAVEMDGKMDGGLLGGLKRKLLAGESLFITYFRGAGAGARWRLPGPIPARSFTCRSPDSRCSASATRSSARRRHRLQRRVHQAAGCGLLRR